MIKLLIKYRLIGMSETRLLPVELVDDCVKEELFSVGHKKELKEQKPFISCLIWGCIGYGLNQPINLTEVTSSIEYENGHIVEIPREIVYDIHRLIGA